MHIYIFTHHFEVFGPLFAQRALTLHEPHVFVQKSLMSRSGPPESCLHRSVPLFSVVQNLLHAGGHSLKSSVYFQF